MKLTSLDSWHCFACGPNHPKGLKLQFDVAVDGSIRTEFTLGDDYTGTGAVIHGGIIATVFDEVMSWALLSSVRKLHMTARMEQRYRRPAPSGVPLIAEASIDRVRGRGLVEVSAKMYATSAPEVVLAEASGVYVETPPQVMETLSDQQRQDLEDLFAALDAR